MESLWGRLGELAMPVAVVAGSQDQKFLAIARRMEEAIPRAQLHVLDGGHALALECPGELARVLDSGEHDARSPCAQTQEHIQLGALRIDFLVEAGDSNGSVTVLRVLCPGRCARAAAAQPRRLRGDRLRARRDVHLDD